MPSVVTASTWASGGAVDGETQLPTDIAGDTSAPGIDLRRLFNNWSAILQYTESILGVAGVNVSSPANAVLLTGAQTVAGVKTFSSAPILSSLQGVLYGNAASAVSALRLTAAGDTLYASASDTLARLAAGSANTLSKMNAAGTAPAWATLLTLDESGAGDLALTKSQNALGPALTVRNVNTGASAAPAVWLYNNTNPGGLVLPSSNHTGFGGANYLTMINYAGPLSFFASADGAAAPARVLDIRNTDAAGPPQSFSAVMTLSKAFNHVGFGVNFTNTGAAADSGAIRGWVFQTTAAAASTLRAGEFHGTIHSTAGNPTYFHGVESEIHSDVASIGIGFRARAQGSIPVWGVAGTRQGQAFWAGGNNGWDYGFYYLDTDDVTGLAYINQAGGIYSKGGIAVGHDTAPTTDSIRLRKDANGITYIQADNRTNGADAGARFEATTDGGTTYARFGLFPALQDDVIAGSAIGGFATAVTNSANGMIIGSVSAAAIGLITNDTYRLTITSAGLITLSGTPYVTVGLEIGNASDTTLTRASAGNLAVEGNLIYRAGGTDVPVTDGGTGSSNASDARTALGLAIGTNVQAWDADLDAIAGLTRTRGDLIVGNATQWTDLAVGAVATILRSDGTDPAWQALNAIPDIVRVTGVANIGTGASAAEVAYSGGAYFQGYDRSASVFRAVRVVGSAVNIVYGSGASTETVRILADSTGLGFFGVTAVARQTIGAAATDAATTQTLANNIRTALINLGLCQA